LTKVLVAATDRSGPAASGSTSPAEAASGASGWLVSASVSAPPFAAAACAAMMSGLRPDCEIATETAPGARSGLP